MTKRLIALLMVLVLGAFVFTGCSSSTSTQAGDVYIGKWSGPLPKDRGTGFYKMEIKRNGNSYLVKSYTEDDGDIYNPTETGATLTKDGMLNTGGGDIITHVKSDNTLKPNWIAVTLKREK